MSRTLVWATLFIGITLSTAWAATPADAPVQELPIRALGRADAPLTITGYSSLTCSHCADFFNNVMPEIEKRYIDTGKVRFIYRDFAMNGIDLKGMALAHCMPKEQFFPFIKIVYKNQATWIRGDKPDATLTQYAEMAGLASDKAKSCTEDTKLMDALVAVRTEAMEKNEIKATPTFIFSDNETKLVGARSLEEFAATVDKVLAKKK
ncbi:MAG: thioredoxin domain-containing protein [Bdellovibrionales bacterium]